jgi:hypothetical protein
VGLRDAVTALRNGDEQAGLQEELRQHKAQADLLQENLFQLELAMAEPGWQRIGSELQKEFTRDGLDKLIALSRAYYLSNPLLQRAVNVTTYYTWAQGVEFKANDEAVQKDVIEPMLEDQGNRAEIYAHQARILTDIDQMVDGNTFTAMVTHDDGMVSLRSIPADEIREIYLDPEDHIQVTYYKRCWAQQKLDNSGRISVERYEAYHPDWTYEPGNQPPDIGGTEIKWDQPVIHQRTGGLKQMRFGIPETYAAIDWARAYRRFLEDWHTIVSSLARFSWRVTTTGKKLDKSKKKLGSTVTQEEPIEKNPQGAPGGFFISAGDDIEPIPKTGATTSAEDGKPSRLMVAAAMNLPDTILSGDPQQGNLATAKTLDRPTELGIQSRQAMWADWHKNVFAYAARRRMSQAKLAESSDLGIEVTFPPILQHDKKEEVSALVSAATLDGKMEAGTIPRDVLARKLMQAVDVDDIEEALENLDTEQQQDVAQAVEALAEALR